MKPALSPETMGRLIDAAGTRQSLDVLFAALASLVPFEMVSVLVYPGRGRPVALYDDFREAAYRQGLDNYLRHSYVLNPCYQAYLGGLRSGVIRIRDLVSAGGGRSAGLAVAGGRAGPTAEGPTTVPTGGSPADDLMRVPGAAPGVPVAVSEQEEIGYVTLGWPPHREEVLVMAPLPDDAAAEIGLLRPRASGGFSEPHIDCLRELHPVITAVIRRYWTGLSGAAATPPDSRIDAAFDNFGKPVLSVREAEIIRMVLQGHSSESIGLHLGISVTTVKTHRKNAYAKLNISTQSELLSLFLKALERG
ncbi:helix-turn-helix transcriptional regulator [Bordetella sp. H567]|uniref:helix-turn-helix transcriptional regulator n=1 Tax=Bordetella sp. H567 TaxID=1697043 RepID=UPI000834C343|nr:LuxR C-terminal-related transcriptional regulator [Bordetella sp. H567]